MRFAKRVVNPAPGVVNLKFASLVSLSPDGFLSGERVGVRGWNVLRKNVSD